MFDYLLLFYGFKQKDEQFMSRIFLLITLSSICYSVAQVLLIIQLNDKILITLIKVMICLAAISSLVSYIYIIIKSSRLLYLLNVLKSLKTDNNNKNKSITYSTIFAIFVILSATIISFSLRDNYPNIKELFEEPIKQLRHKNILQLTSDLSIIINYVFNFGWKITLQLIYYNIKREYLSILMSFNEQLVRRNCDPCVHVVDSTHRTVIKFFEIESYIHKNINFINYFIRIDITVIFLCHLLLCIHSVSDCDLRYFSTLFVYILIIYFYYTSSQLIELKVKYEKNSIKQNILKWEQNVNNSEMVYIQWNTLKRTVHQLIDFSETYV